jgi:hypothetical protein
VRLSCFSSPDPHSCLDFLATMAPRQEKSQLKRGRVCSDLPYFEAIFLTTHAAYRAELLTKRTPRSLAALNDYLNLRQVLHRKSNSLRLLLKSPSPLPRKDTRRSQQRRRKGAQARRINLSILARSRKQLASHPHPRILRHSPSSPTSHLLLMRLKMRRRRACGDI